ncbi:MAG: TRAP transporter small permease [Bacillota bacterium]|nr:TRAP transporter small permease [Bacillota bacterium]
MKMEKYDSARKFEHGITKLEDFFLFAALIVLTGSILIQIIGRYVLRIPTPWCEELARYLFIALTYVGSGRAFINGGHIGIDLVDTLVEKHSKEPVGFMKKFNRVSVLVTEAFIICFGVIYIQYLQKIAARPQVSASMHINMLIPMSFVLIGILLMIYHNICRLFYDYEAAEKEKEGEEA